MKRKILSIFCVLCILSLFVESIYALDYKTVFIKDLNTNNLVSNAYITILNIESGKSYNYITDDTGNINIPINEYNELNGPILYISSHNNEYYGSYSMNMSNNTLYVEEDSSFRNGNLARSAVDWNVISSSYVDDIYVPIAQVATYGGLKAGLEFHTSYTFTISGSSILGSGTYNSSGFSGRKKTELCKTNSPQWMNFFGLYARYKVVEVYPATGETRTRYFIAGKCLELKCEYATRTTGTTITTNAREILFNKNTVYRDEQTFGSSTDYTYTYSGKIKTSTGTSNTSYTTTIKVKMGLSGGNKVTYIYSVPSAVNRKYEIGFNKIKVSS